MTEILKRFENVKKRYRELFKEELRLFDDNFGDRITELQNKIAEERKNHNCAMCGSCCKLAATPYSYEKLKELAANGDNYATQFVDTFVPYDDATVIKELYPDYFETLEITNQKINFYHCTLVTEDNKCPKYEDRPQICRDFPDNPIEILPKKCEFNRWQSLVLDDVLRLKAIVELQNLEKENE